MTNEKAPEYKAPPEKIPMTVSQRELAADCEKLWRHKPAEAEDRRADEISR